MVDTVFNLLIWIWADVIGLPSFNHENSSGCDPEDTTHMRADVIPTFALDGKEKGVTTGGSKNVLNVSLMFRSTQTCLTQRMDQRKQKQDDYH